MAADTIPGWLRHPERLRGGCREPGVDLNEELARRYGKEGEPFFGELGFSVLPCRGGA
jgi:hypothetical protein